jgi:phosphoesterase RecJ-like protein
VSEGPIADTDWARAAGLLLHAPEVALACHVVPDGDALGSMLGLAVALDRAGVPTVCSWGQDPVDVPARYDFLPGQDRLVSAEKFPAAPDVLVVLDTSARHRLGLLADRLDTARAVVILDHHARGADIDGLMLLDDRAAATAVLVAELLDRSDLSLDRDVALCLYTALSTDTGSFKFESTTPAVHQLAGRLLATGIPHHEVARRIWDTNSVGYIRLLGLALDRLVIEPDAVGGRGLAWTHTTTAEMDAYRVGIDEIEGVIDVVRTVAEAEVAAVCKEDRDGSYKVSVRAKSAVDVGAACATLGGGGHRLAAGYTSFAALTLTVSQLREALAAAPAPG